MRWVWRIAVWGFILLLIAIGAFVGYFKSLPTADPQKLAAADARYNQIRALFPAPLTTTQTAASAIPNVSDANSTAVLQARCDQLFASLSTLDAKPSFYWTLPRFTREELDAARGLAAMYDKGMRVSPEARAKYKWFTAPQMVESLAKALVADLQPGDKWQTFSQKLYAIDFDKLSPAERAKRFERYELALKFLRVTGCPAGNLNIREQFDMSDVLGKSNGPALRPLPPEYSNLDLKLLAPREPLDWDFCLATVLERERKACLNFEEMTHAAKAFEMFKDLSIQSGRGKWYEPAIANVSGVIGAVIGPPKFIVPALESELRIEQNIQNYAVAYKKNALTHDILSKGRILEFQLEQLRSRLVAGGIELRRGGSVPTPDQIGPDSYFFDPMTQRPYLLYAKTEPTGLVRLSVRRPIMKDTQQNVEGREVFSIMLPANHPGLDRVPRF